MLCSYLVTQGINTHFYSFCLFITDLLEIVQNFMEYTCSSAVLPSIECAYLKVYRACALNNFLFV